MNRAYRLYRFDNDDGSAKEWAYADLGTGSAEIRWGKAGALRSSQIKGIQVAQARSDDKERKGYRYVGMVALDGHGARVAVPTVPPMAAPTQSSVRPPPAKPTRKPIDIAALLGGDDDGFYF